MRIVFPFAVKAIDSHSVEVDFVSDGNPLVKIDPHPDLVKVIPERQMDKLFCAFEESLMQASIRIMSDRKHEKMLKKQQKNLYRS